ncbi:CLUMA_CG008533, isoform A [Clunio marinus]|uniref:CLUMA_CG008533, isoform A n=1 Tax=Clunio marinus TaxID=568069 RepID=A0A1J1I5M8_9DIPT|nr:CLUMA_CG008533, isoform A [Clunio marinus]
MKEKLQDVYKILLTTLPSGSSHHSQSALCALLLPAHNDSRGVFFVVVVKKYVKFNGVSNHNCNDVKHRLQHIICDAKQIWVCCFMVFGMLPAVPTLT